MAVASLKADYRDSQYESRKFNLVENDDGTTSFADATEYTIKGDEFGAKDINTTNGRINEITKSWSVSVGTDGWTDTAPYTKTISVSGMKEEYEPLMCLVVPSGLTGAQTTQLEKAYGSVSRFITADDSITIYCNKKKPSQSFTIKLKGV